MAHFNKTGGSNSDFCRIFLIRSKREGYLFAEQSFFINIARAKLKGVSKRFFDYHLYIIRTTDYAINTSKAV